MRMTMRQMSKMGVDEDDGGTKTYSGREWRKDSEVE